MQLGTLDHVNIRTSRLDQMIAWYGDILGMTNGKRPPFSFPGAWLYVGDKAYVHLIGIDHEPGANSKDLKLEHFALSATGLDIFIAHLDKAGENYDKRVVPGFGIIQINIWDPDRNHVHIDFAANED